MKNLKYFAFGSVLTLSILLCCVCFKYAAYSRGYSGTIGGEVFTIALPLSLMFWRIETEERAKTYWKNQAASWRSMSKFHEDFVAYILEEKTKKQDTQSPHTATAQNVAENPTE